MRLELTRRGDYAIRAVIALARAPQDAVVSAPRLAAATGIPPRFVAQVMTEVVRAGIAEGRVGRAGGYRLARDPATISLLDIVEAVEGDPRRRLCVFSSAPCLHDGECDVHAVFATAQDALLAELDRSTVAEVAARPHGQAGVPMARVVRTGVPAG